MPRKSKFTDEQIIRALREVDGGAKASDVFRRLGVTDADLVPLAPAVRRNGRPRGQAAPRPRGRERQAEEAPGRPDARQRRAQGRVLKKMVKLTARRRAVGYVQQAWGLSEQRACRVMGLCRATARYEPTRIYPPDLVK